MDSAYHVKGCVLMSEYKVPELWEAVEEVPIDRLKTIAGGRLKGKSDINPQWRIKRMTEVYGMCGQGWNYKIIDTKFVPGAGDEVMVFVTVELKVSTDNTWSDPIVGVGGNLIVVNEGKGLRSNDEGVKMAVTDALGNAMKYIGVASRIFEGDFDGSKYKDQPDSDAKIVCISEDQKIALSTAMVQLSVDDMKALLKWAEVEKIDDVPATLFDTMMKAIERKTQEA